MSLYLSISIECQSQDEDHEPHHQTPVLYSLPSLGSSLCCGCTYVSHSHSMYVQWRSLTGCRQG